MNAQQEATVLNISDPDKRVTLNRQLVLSIPLVEKFKSPPQLNSHNALYVVLPSERTGMIPTKIKVGAIQAVFKEKGHYKIKLKSINEYETNAKLFPNEQPYNYIPINKFTPIV